MSANYSISLKTNMTSARMYNGANIKKKTSFNGGQIQNSYQSNFGNNKDSFTSSQKQREKELNRLLKTATKSYDLSRYPDAIKNYKKYLEINPDCYEVQLKLAKSYKQSDKLPDAIKTYQNILENNPADLEVLTLAGECFKDLNMYENAIKYYKQATAINPNFDLAHRAVKELDNLILGKFNPNLAQIKKNEHKNASLKESLNLLRNKAPKDLVNALNGINIQFGETGELGGHSNIAQYEDAKGKITVSDCYCWASPKVVSAYLVHEAVHAKDRDPYTSITEEQDAYREQVKFWIDNNNGTEDPELDYAAFLYEQSPKKLDDKIEDVYGARDCRIRMYSPHHTKAMKNPIKRFLASIPIVGEIFE